MRLHVRTQDLSGEAGENHENFNNNSRPYNSLPPTFKPLLLDCGQSQ